MFKIKRYSKNVFCDTVLLDITSVNLKVFVINM